MSFRQKILPEVYEMFLKKMKITLNLHELFLAFNVCQLPKDNFHNLSFKSLVFHNRLHLCNWCIGTYKHFNLPLSEHVSVKQIHPNRWSVRMRIFKPFVPFIILSDCIHCIVVASSIPSRTVAVNIYCARELLG